MRFVRFEPRTTRPNWRPSSARTGLAVRVFDAASCLVRYHPARGPPGALGRGAAGQEDMPTSWPRLLETAFGSRTAFSWRPISSCRPVDFREPAAFFLAGSRPRPQVHGGGDLPGQGRGLPRGHHPFPLRSPCMVGGEVAVVVEPDRCVACLTCVRTCPYGVPQINDQGVAYIDPAACQGCGNCASACPQQADPGAAPHRRPDYWPRLTAL